MIAKKLALLSMSPSEHLTQIFRKFFLLRKQQQKQKSNMKKSCQSFTLLYARLTKIDAAIQTCTYPAMNSIVCE